MSFIIKVTNQQSVQLIQHFQGCIGYRIHNNRFYRWLIIVVDLRDKLNF